VSEIPELSSISRRVLLKLSGEILGAEQGAALDGAGLALVAGQIEGALHAGSQVAVVCGGGNILRGSGPLGRQLPRTTADLIGMVATLANALALHGVLTQRGVPSRVLSAFEVPRVAELHNPRLAKESLARGEVVLFAGGTGNPYFTTDTAAALRALELDCTLLIKGTKVDGVYDEDPARNPQAKCFRRLTHSQVLQQRLGVMDLTAITLCMENALPIVVLNATCEGSVAGFLGGQDLGTLISSGADRPAAG
jgi:uridylate kinase